jgi:hypothetical protein
MSMAPALIVMQDGSCEGRQPPVPVTFSLAPAGTRRVRFPKSSVEPDVTENPFVTTGTTQGSAPGAQTSFAVVARDGETRTI